MWHELVLKIVTGMAAPEGAEDTGGHGVILLVFYVGLFAIFYFLLIRPQSQRTKKTKNMQESLEKGDSIVTSGGILGVVHKLKDDVVTVEIAEDVRIKVLKSAISENKKASSEGVKEDSQ